MSMDQLAKKKVLYWEEHSNLTLLRGYSWYKIEIKRAASAACSVHHSLLWYFHAWWWLLIGNWSNHATQGAQALSSNQSGNLNQPLLDCCCSLTQLCPTLQPHGLQSPWNSPSQNTGVGSFYLLQEIFPTQESNISLLHCRQILYQLSYDGNPFWCYSKWNCFLNVRLLIASI